MKHLVEGDAREGLAIPTIGGRVAKHALDIGRLSAIVSSTLSQECSTNVTVETNGFRVGAFSLM
jgi:hypothetical protein